MIKSSFSNARLKPTPTGASISRHLAILKDADLIRSKREGKFIYYELNTSVLEDVMLWITDLKGVSDYEGND